MAWLSHACGLLAMVLTLLIASGCKDSEHAEQTTRPTTTPTYASVLPDDVAALPAKADEIVGIVHVDGALPALKPVDVSSCADCARLHPTGLPDDTILSGPGGALQNAVVYLSMPPTAGASPAATALPPVQLDQVGCRYEPHVVALQTGQTLNVTSSDAFIHNVHGQAIDNPAFNFSDRQRTLTFATPEIFPVRCDVHPWMKAWIAVFPGASFSVSDAAGTFRIPAVRPGHYTLTAWHERLGKLTREIDVTKDQPLRISLVYTR